MDVCRDCLTHNKIEGPIVRTLQFKLCNKCSSVFSDERRFTPCICNMGHAVFGLDGIFKYCLNCKPHGDHKIKIEPHKLIIFPNTCIVSHCKLQIVTDNYCIKHVEYKV